MRSQNVLREYNMSDSEMCFLASKICSYLTRDLADLQDFGITAQKITDLKTLITAFESFPDDDYYLGASMLATELKNQKVVELKEDYRKMILRINMVWGDNQSRLRQVSASEYYTATPDKLLTMARKTHTFAEENLTELTPAGLTQALLDKFKQLTDELYESMLAQDEAVFTRDNKATERGNKGNEIYRFISMYCEIGKKLYVKTDPSKYNDYLIYGHAAGGLKPPVNLAYRPGDFVISWNPVENATSYELEYSPDGAAWVVAYSGSDDAVQYIPAVEGWAYFRCRARNSNGYGEFSEVLKAGYYQQIPPPNNVKAKIEEHTENGLLLTWDEVPSATVYKIYTSVVPIGSPSNSFVFLGKPKVNNYSCEIERGKRHYFQLTAENSAQWSQRSEAIYLDVEQNQLGIENYGKIQDS